MLGAAVTHRRCSYCKQQRGATGSLEGVEMRAERRVKGWRNKWRKKAAPAPRPPVAVTVAARPPAMPSRGADFGTARPPAVPRHGMSSRRPAAARAPGAARPPAVRPACLAATARAPIAAWPPAPPRHGLRSRHLGGQRWQTRSRCRRSRAELRICGSSTTKWLQRAGTPRLRRWSCSIPTPLAGSGAALEPLSEAEPC
ncbi:hypothetical protein PVAP13_1KG386715 [Panicum virgatum]|uniref:Uncharacterized protein n=1 Tax=Panicum virgatum TaxID=38727 RepID=A0A8T0XLV0_PANVG|nr:hypothetical protein PVAP13_1KG386715 [Panicum virgatum]